MNTEKACYYKPTFRDKLRHIYYAVKFKIYMEWHWLYWKVLHLTGLARPYSVMMCKLNLYQQFPDGRCHWCGNIHGVRLK